MAESKLTRIAIVNKDRCKPKKCHQECKKSCPVVRQGKLCIEVTPTSKICFISEELCIGCGICVKKCPFEAIHIINLPKDLASNTTHRYGPNSFKLHRLPMPRPGQVLGLVGTNGIGKSTALKVLAGKLKPNLGRFENPPDWEEILTNFRGSELQNYFTKVLEENIKAIIKPQYVDHIPKAVTGTVGEILQNKCQRHNFDWVVEQMDLNHVLDRTVDVLSGGELQRFAIAVVVVQRADVYMFDEPSSYLDVKQRLQAAHAIRAIVDETAEAISIATATAAGTAMPAAINENDGGGPRGGISTGGKNGRFNPNQRYVMVVEHDLAVLDYLSDFVCCLYGKPSAYGVVTMPYSVREGINVFLAGFVPTENLRFREEALTFKVAQNVDTADNSTSESHAMYQYPAMTKTMKSKPKPGQLEADRAEAAAAAAAGGSDAPKNRQFVLHVEAGQFTDSEIIVMLGENGTGKTTFIRMLAGLLKSDEQEEAEAAGDMEGAATMGVPQLNVSYKPQKISPKFAGPVQLLLVKKIKEAYLHPQFGTDVLKPLSIEEISDQSVQNLSGGELQRVAICLALGKPADIYLIDEPSAYLDSEQRISCSKVIKRFVLHAKKTAFVVEHDFIMATYLADRVVVYTGVPGIETTATAPQALLTGMNMFLAQLMVTFRRDPTNFRPRINKYNSTKDREQKSSGNYFFLETDD